MTKKQNNISFACIQCVPAGDGGPGGSDLAVATTRDTQTATQQQRNSNNKLAVIQGSTMTTTTTSTDTKPTCDNAVCNASSNFAFPFGFTFAMYLVPQVLRFTVNVRTSLTQTLIISCGMPPAILFLL